MFKLEQAREIQFLSTLKLKDRLLFDAIIPGINEPKYACSLNALFSIDFM